VLDCSKFVTFCKLVIPAKHRISVDSLTSFGEAGLLSHIIILDDNHPVGVVMEMRFDLTCNYYICVLFMHITYIVIPKGTP
jgi:hypothetical protein